MFPFDSITHWKRHPDDSDTKSPQELAYRKRKESETRDDLTKPVQQLLCDVHEEAGEPISEGISEDKKLNVHLARTIGQTKRLVALHTVTAYQSAIAAWWLKWLTIVLTALTLILVGLTIRIVHFANNTDRQVRQQIRLDQERYAGTPLLEVPPELATAFEPFPTKPFTLRRTVTAEEQLRFP